MTQGSFVPLPGSEREALPDVQDVGPVEQTERIEVTLVTRRRAPLPAEVVETPATLSREELARAHGTDPADLERVREALGAFGLEITSTDAGSRRVKVAGPASALTQAFGTSLRLVSSPGPAGTGRVEHRYREGRLQLPAALEGIVLAVLGLDNRPQAIAHFRVAPEAAAAAASYTPPQIAKAYQFPAGTDGTGQTVAIIELGGGFTSSDLQTYFSGLGITAPSVTAASVDGASNAPGTDPTGPDGEVMLDIEVVGAVAPGAAQVVYFAPNTDQGFMDAVTDAAHAATTPIAISISWGSQEDAWTPQSRNAMDQALSDALALGVTVTAAAGDSGSTDGVTDGKNHCDYPASSPYVLGCGGTRLDADPTTGTIASETVWNEPSGGATGGGVSDVYPVPSWQSTAGVPAASGTGGRGVPDVAGNADPKTGYQVLVHGKQNVYGGTSAVAPLWAGLIARLAQGTGKKFGLLQALIYPGVAPGKDVPGFNDITTGNNGAYSAGPGWDPCTGLGSPNGTALLTRLKG
jgi:kumamolisin